MQLLVFPELSLTGYERGLAAELAIAPDAEVLQPLRDFAREVGVTTVVGMPIRLSDDSPVLIGALVLGADGSLGVYSKQHLHPGEEVAFAPGTGGSTLKIGSRYRRVGGMRGFFSRQSCGSGGAAGRRSLCGGRADHGKRLRPRYRAIARLCQHPFDDGPDGQPWWRNGWLGIGRTQCDLGGGRDR